MAGLFNTTLVDLLNKISGGLDIKDVPVLFQDPGAASVGAITPIERTDIEISNFTPIPGAAREYQKWGEGDYPITYYDNPMVEVDPSVAIAIKQGRLSDTFDALTLPFDVLGVSSLFRTPAKVASKNIIPEVVENAPSLQSVNKPTRVSAPKNKYGFYSAVEEQGLNLKRKAGPGQAFINEFSKNPKVTADEMNWTGLTDWLKSKKNVTKEEVQDFISKNKVDIIERLRTDSPPSNIEHASYNLPNGENLQETTLGIKNYKDKEVAKSWTPENEKRYKELYDNYLDELHGKDIDRSPEEINEFNSLWIKKQAVEKSSGFKFESHYPEKDYFAHWRTNERVDAEGTPIRFVEEVQYDWGQEGKRTGFGNLVTLNKVDNNNFEFVDIKTNEVVDTFEGSYQDAWNKVDALNKNTVGNNPFFRVQQKTTLKRILQQAVDDGIDTLGFSKASLQKERWNKGLKVESITAEPLSNMKISVVDPKLRYSLDVKDSWRKDKELAYSVDLTPVKANEGNILLYVGKDGKIVKTSREDYDAEFVNKKLKNVIPEEIANEILDSPIETEFTTDFKLGGKGFDFEYDEVNPAILNKLGKEYGAKVTTKELDIDGKKIEYFQFKIPKKMAEDIKEKGQPLFSAAPALPLASQEEQDDDIYTNPLLKDPFDYATP